MCNRHEFMEGPPTVFHVRQKGELRVLDRIIAQPTRSPTVLLLPHIRICQGAQEGAERGTALHAVCL